MAAWRRLPLELMPPSLRKKFQKKPRSGSSPGRKRLKTDLDVFDSASWSDREKAESANQSPEKRIKQEPLDEEEQQNEGNSVCF